MKYSQGILPLNSQKPGIQMLVALMVILFVSVILICLTILLGWLIFRMGISDVSTDLDSISSIQRSYLKYTQALQHISIFLAPSLLVAFLMTGKISGYLKMDTVPGLTQFSLVLILSLILIPLISDLGIWNSRLKLPDWLGRLEGWMRTKEDEAGILTAWLIYSKTTGGLVINIFILAILPALGEEFLFRGLFQQILSKVFRSAHFGILLTSIVFSLFHLQFFGFIPRMALGIVYGYLFFWSGSIWLPVLAHFINNLIPVVVAHLVGWESVNTDIQDFIRGEGYIFLIPLALSGLLMFIIRDQSKNPNSVG
jgi:membrane protease YdiL (CAAX protease family)